MVTKSRDEPLVTVVVPSFNHAPYVAQCISSIVSQDYPCVELIVVDDGSSDESPEILRGLAEEHGFRLIVQRNAGICRALNHGASLGRGEYLAVCASDDYWLPGKLRRQVEHLEAHPELAGCSGNVLRVDKSGRVQPGQADVPARRYGFEDFLISRYYFPAPAVMLRRTMFDAVGGFDPRFRIEDWPMWLRLTKAGHQLDLLEPRLACYRIHGANLHSQVKRMVDERASILAEYRSSPQYERALKELRLRAFFELAAESRTAALGYLRPVLVASPGDWRTWVGVGRLIAGRRNAERLDQLVARTLAATAPRRRWLARVLRPARPS